MQVILKKDAQQVEVLRRMVKDLFFDLNLRVVPIVREESGLARSSRNTYLSAEEKQAAVILSKALKQALDSYKNGEHNKDIIILSYPVQVIFYNPVQNHAIDIVMIG